ncbi:diaminopimelate decarboxylase, partial [bacterium]|nr:diaminopimelate decarboxylase [bacterium]
YAIEQDILAFHVESWQELGVIDDIARLKKRVAEVALRVNPNIAIEGHPYISTATAIDKFGMDWDTVQQAFENMRDFPNLRLVGLHAHLGSQITSVEPYAKLVRFMSGAITDLRAQGAELDYLNIGGGIGVSYRHVLEPPSPQCGDLSVDGILLPLRDDLAQLECKITIEPGRVLVAEAGVLVTQVLYRKVSHGKPFVIVDAGMNDLVRPTLYDAYHEILPLEETTSEREQVDVVGPLCESGDFLAKGRTLPKLQRGDYLAVMTVGAYGFTLSSNYNARLRPAEVLVDGGDYRVIREPGKIENLWA